MNRSRGNPIRFIFDMDGVLVDSRPAVEAAYLEAGVTMPPKAWGKPWVDWLVEACEGDYDKAVQIHAKKGDLYKKHLNKIVPLAGATALHLLNQSTRGAYPCRCGIYTNASFSAYRIINRRFRFPAEILSCSDFGHRSKQAVLQEFKNVVVVDDDPGMRAFVKQNGSALVHFDESMHKDPHKLMKRILEKENEIQISHTGSGTQ